ncbi:pantothenate transporter liz1 [Drepanopeziza brunnea f. sp. 'multigermtubi' MB_m1]|uniref:Pantothenate transporter liz1 n=1 Tax=Marssonina brunnea f. sp. multigermtubi (strain MB_m1) TaxID=1072389 RepID=K1WLG4_MARBU|nr:pantothenate transporter liz1 [Drepanopeziza brunnea f. sp. 'multigermtubi' MB_m1]EKD13666.1 pantothenate transporter liz1 [Drepanopeziza brunnea f. sp. 'multigermtubi' MB_m1]
MSAQDDKLENGIVVDTSSDKAIDLRIDNSETGTASAAGGSARPRREAPEFIRSMAPEVRAATELRLRKKLDLRIMPMIVLMYIMNYLDRNNIAAAKLAGIITDLNLSDVEFQPGCLYYLSCWYTRKELGFRTAIFYSGALISGAFSGLIAAGVRYNMDGLHGLRAWRWLFIIEGAATIGIAIAAFFVLPNFPRTTSWLTAEERALAIWRLEEDIGEDDWLDSEHQSFTVGLKLAFSDVKTYVLMFLLFGIVAAGTVTNFFPTVVKTLGQNDVNTLLLTAPPYVLAVITTFLNSWHADRTGERFFHIALPLLFAIAAYVLAAATTSTAPRYVAMMLMVPGVYTGYVVALAWISNSIPRPPAKRAAALAFINAISNSSSIYASYMYGATYAPRYVVAMGVNCAMASMAILAAVVLRVILVRLNRKLEQGKFVDGAINSGGFKYRL